MWLELPTQSLLGAAIFSGIVLILFWVEYRRIRGRLFLRELQMKRRMYELSILRELGERIGYSLNIQKIVDIIGSSLGDLLPYSIVGYMLPDEEGRIVFRINLAESVSKNFLTEVRSRMLKAFSVLFGKVYADTDIDESISGVVTDPSGKKEVRSFFNIPIVINDKPAGILTVAATKSGLYRTSEEVEILYTIMNQASEAISKLQTVLDIEKGKLNSMVASMADGVLMVNTKNRLLVINPKTKEILSLKEPDPTIFDVLDSLADKFDLRTKIEESLKNDELVVEKDVRLGRWFLQILITPVKDKKGEPLGAVVLFQDITREKELEKMREDFTSMMVHELRSPLTGIRSISTLLDKDTIKNDKGKYKEFVQLISTNANSMLDLVNDLLDVAKLESGKFEVFTKPTEIKHVIKLRLESFAALGNESKVSIEQKITPEVPDILTCDENKVSQVLNNLLSNAIKFTHAGGKIVISAFVCKAFQDLAEAAETRNLGWYGVKHGMICSTDSLVIAISNSGVGVPQAEMPKLFNKFQQLSTAIVSGKKGTGLGLVIVKGIIEAHGGQVGVFSEEGKGATFFLTIPVKPAAAPGIVMSAKNKVTA